MAKPLTKPKRPRQALRARGAVNQQPRSKKTKKAKKAKNELAPPVSETTIFRLYVLAGGRCSFPGCPAYVMEEPLTTRSARLGNVAHIVAERRDGTRGMDPLAMSERGNFENLILLCTMHHSFIDKNEQGLTYPASLLRKYKRLHEASIKAATSIVLNDKTHAIRLLGQIRGNVIAVSNDEIRAAVFAHERRHVDEFIDIDIGTIPDDDGSSYFTTAMNKIEAELGRRVLPQIQDGTIKRISVFALSRIPLICHLGYELGDKVPTVLYQKNRDDGESWIWPLDGEAVKFEVIPHGPSDANVPAILASVSGGDVNKVLRATHADRILEIRPVGVQPSRTLLRSPATLANFRTAYHEALGMIECQFSGVESVDFFLAVPAPVALICGRDVLRDVAPRVVVYDIVDGGEYSPVMTIPRTASALAGS